MPGWEAAAGPRRPASTAEQGAYSHPELWALNASIDCGGCGVRHTPGHLVESASEQALRVGCRLSRERHTPTGSVSQGRRAKQIFGVTQLCRLPNVAGGAGGWGECCLGCIIRSSSVSNSHLKALCGGNYCSFWFRDETRREPQVPQPAHGGAGHSPWPAGTHEKTTLTPDGCPLPPQSRACGLLSPQRCLNRWRQTSTCLLHVIFPAILF